MTERWPVQIDPIFGCAIWQGKVSRDGYGIIWRGQRPTHAHRVVYEAEVGPIPEGKVLDHSCAAPRCCLPAHLEPVTQSENLRRKSWRNRVRLTHCKKGHALDGANAIVTSNGGRICRTCTRGDKDSAGH